MKLYPLALGGLVIPLLIFVASAHLSAEEVEGLLHPVAVGDPQLKTDHPWFPGELSCSTFERLFSTQAALYYRVTGRNVDSEEDKAIASWYWRNLNYYHNFSPRENYWGKKFSLNFQDNDDVVYEYWSGLFSYGFSLCGTTHSQYTAEMNHLLGHCRSRAVDVQGHTSFEVFLKDIQYGPHGDWALLDHDISTIVFNNPETPQRLLNLWDISYAKEPPNTIARTEAEREAILDNGQAPKSNRGWFKSGLYYPNENLDANNSDSVGCYTSVNSVAPLSGYSSVPPMISLRRNEILRRYLQPGLEEGTYVYWGPNMNLRGIPGPARDRTWVCEPERMFRATRDTDTATVARYGNAVYTYKPSFTDGSYRDGVISEDEKSVTFYFQSPYAIAATPAAVHSGEMWATFFSGCTNGLTVSASNGRCSTQISVDNGQSWSEPLEVAAEARVDLTDQAKGLHSYHLRLNAPATDLAKMGIEIQTICMANNRLIPHLKSDGTTVTYAASGTAIFSAGPNVQQAKALITDGGLGQDRVEMTVPSPNRTRIKAIYASAQVASKNPPGESVRYQIEYSSDEGESWHYVVQDWQIKKLGYQASDHLSKSFCYGSQRLTSDANKIVLRFTNDGGVKYQRTEVHLAYETPNNSPVRVTFQWADGDKSVMKTASHIFPTQSVGTESTWKIATEENVETRWVEMQLAR